MSDRYRELRARAHTAHVYGEALQLPPEDRLTKNQLHVLRYMALHEGDAFTAASLKEAMRMPSKPARILYDLGAVKGLLDEDEEDNSWTINHAGLRRVEHYNRLEAVRSEESRSKAAASQQLFIDAAAEAGRARAWRVVNVILVMVVLAACLIGALFWRKP